MMLPDDSNLNNGDTVDQYGSCNHALLQLEVANLLNTI